MGIFRRVAELEAKGLEHDARLDAHDSRLDDHDERIAALEDWEEKANSLLLRLPQFEKMTEHRLSEAMENIMGLVDAFENMEAEIKNLDVKDRGRRLVAKLCRVHGAAQRELDGRRPA